MPSREVCVRGKSSSIEIIETSLVALFALQDEYTETKQLPSYVTRFEVIPGKEEPDGTLETVPCVVINVVEYNKAHPKNLHPLPDRLPSLLIEREVDALTRYCFQRSQGLVGTELDNNFGPMLENTVAARTLLKQGIPIRYTDRDTCIVPLIYPYRGTAEGTTAQDFINQIELLAYAGVTQDIQNGKNP